MQGAPVELQGRGNGRDLLVVDLPRNYRGLIGSGSRSGLAAREDIAEELHHPHQQNQHEEHEADTDECHPQHLRPAPVYYR